MRAHPVIRLAAIALVTSLVAGCGNKVTAPGTLSQQSADDLAVQAATSLAVAGGDVQFAIVTMPLAPPAAAGRVAPAWAAWDTTVSANGLTYEASRTFYDAGDNELPGYSVLAVRMRWTSRAYGSYQGLRDTATVGHASLLDVRGIQAGQDTVRFDGVCRDTLENRFRSLDGLRERHFHWTGSSTLDDVRILKSTLGTSGWPISGTVVIEVSADRMRSNSSTEVEAHFEAVVIVVFDGTSEPEIIVNGSHHYRWNMQTGLVRRA